MESAAPWDEAALAEAIRRHLGPEHVPRRLQVVEDTTEFFDIGYHAVVLLDGHPFLMRGYEREGRFGLDEEPKYWVRRAVDLATGETKIIKLVFEERIETRIGTVRVECVRSAAKEAAILERVARHPSFMHGRSVTDRAGNVVRILDPIPGPRLDQVVEGLAAAGHERYYHEALPGLLDRFRDIALAIGYLHNRGLRHGDVRRDHVLHDRETGRWRWIDFDYDCSGTANPFAYDLFGLGNILVFLVGGGDVTLHALKRAGHPALERLGPEDMNLVLPHRVANLAKVFPYLDPALGRVLRHFSAGANLFYETVDVLLEELEAVSL
ncbi:MAG: hypothetical protein D6739_07165 [Nitrospirae bacterium]|nr:MAG: hypothetical protein D6739_07165 [Nitrospirota bacterium]